MNRNINQLVGEIVSLAVLITSNTKADVFINYSAHCDVLNIAIHSDGWKSGVSSDIDQAVYTKPDKYRSEEDLVKKLTLIKRELIKIARKGKISFLKLPYEIEEVKRYHLI